MIRINLLPVREARRKADLQQQFVLIAAAAVGSLVLAAGVHQFVRSSVTSANKRVEVLKTQLAQFKPQQEQVDAFKAKKADIEQKLEVIDRLERSRSGPVHILDELASRTPERVWLTTLSANGGKIEIEGHEPRQRARRALPHRAQRLGVLRERRAQGDGAEDGRLS